MDLKHCCAALARNIENLMIQREVNPSPLVKGAAGAAASLISATVFPIFLTLELFLKRIPKVVLSIGTENFEKKTDKALKYSLAIGPSILLGLPFPEGVPGFFLRRETKENEVRPFGVEAVFGRTIDNPIESPISAEEVQAIVKNAKELGQQVSVIGAGMSQGTQTIPSADKHRVIHMKHLNAIHVNAAENTVTVGAGATWEQIQLELDKVNKSAIVKQASDIFSVGGSIAINGIEDQSAPEQLNARSFDLIFILFNKLIAIHFYRIFDQLFIIEDIESRFNNHSKISQSSELAFKEKFVFGELIFRDAWARAR